MDEVFRQTLREVILGNAAFPEIVSSISEDTITYNSSGVWVDGGAPGFSGYTTSLTDEELVRAYLLLQLCTEFGYVASPQVLRVETVYKPVGRPTGKGGRADVLVRHPQDQGGGCFLFVECKTPDTYDRDFKLIGGQLFRLSLQELPRPRYLLYYTVDSTIEGLRDRLVLIDTTSFADFDSWDRAGQPITDAIPIRYGRPRVKRFANVDSYSEDYRPLDKTTSAAVFNRLREEFHDVIWAGGGTNNNEVFTYIVKLLLCKIYDEKETGPGCEYQFQRRGDETSPESPASLVDRLNEMYRRSEEDDSDKAHAALQSWVAQDITRIATHLMTFEVANALHRRVLRGELNVRRRQHPHDGTAACVAARTPSAARPSCQSPSTCKPTQAKRYLRRSLPGAGGEFRLRAVDSC